MSPLLMKYLGRQEQAEMRLAAIRRANRKFVFTLNQQRYHTWCRQWNQRPQDHYAITAEYQVRGFHMDPGNVVLLCDFWMSKVYDDIRESVLFASEGTVDLDAHPVTYT
jgi:hypothetical protein